MESHLPRRESLRGRQVRETDVGETRVIHARGNEADTGATFMVGGRDEVVFTVAIAVVDAGDSAHTAFLGVVEGQV